MSIVFTGRLDGYELKYFNNGYATYTLNGCQLWSYTWNASWTDMILFKSCNNNIYLISYKNTNGELSIDLLTHAGYTQQGSRITLETNLDFQYFGTYDNRKDVIISISKTGARRYYDFECPAAVLKEFTPCCDLTSELVKKITELEKRVNQLENTCAAKITTQIVQAPNHYNSVTAGEFTPIAGTNATVTITRPSKLIAFTQFHSIAVPNGQGQMSVDVTSALNGKLMTLGGFNNLPWPVGTSISHCRDWTNGVSITQEVVQPGSYQFDIRARLRFLTGTPASVNAPAALLFIVPL